MNEYGIWLLMVPLAGYFLWTQLRGRVSDEDARRYLREGATVLDVRSVGEFASDRLPGARNLPLDEIGTRIAQLVPEKDRVILCHCLSGARSGAAVGRLRRMGYAKVYNLGSRGRAARLLR